MAYYLVVGKTRAELATSKADYIENVDGDYKQTEYVDTSDDGGRPIRNGLPGSGRALKPDNMPTRLKRVHAHKEGLSDLYPAPYGHYVSDRFKALVDRFEPGVHQFFPMTVTTGNTAMGTLYYFNICNRIDGLDHAACVPPFTPEARSYRPGYTPADKLVLSRQATQDFHVWRDKFYIHAWTSDAFHEAVLAEGLVGLAESSRQIEAD